MRPSAVIGIFHKKKMLDVMIKRSDEMIKRSDEMMPEPQQEQENHIHFTQDWDVGLGGGVWSTGLAMAKYFQQHAAEINLDLMHLCLSKKRDEQKLYALELGSGNGYLSCCFAHHFGSLCQLLVVTDLGDHVPLITQTMENNSHFIQIVKEDELDMIKTESNKVKAMVLEHEWGHVDKKEAEDSSSILHQIKFDFIFGTDIAYRHYLHEALIESLKYLSHSKTLIFIGITLMDTDGVFFQRLLDAGFTYNRLSDHLLDPEFRGSTFGLFLVQRKQQSIGGM